MNRAATLNRLLANMQDEDFRLLSKHLERVEFPRLYRLSAPGQISDFCYFVESGIASIMLALEPGVKRAEIGIVGREGMAPTAPILNAPSTPFTTFIQIPGWGLRVRSSVLLHILSESYSLQNLLKRYAQTMVTQTAFTTVISATATIELRMARWILMCHDRVDGDSIHLTHEYLAMMLSVRRQSISTALPILEGKNLISASRNRITVVNRNGLLDFVGTAYGSPEAEYRRLMGFAP